MKKIIANSGFVFTIANSLILIIFLFLFIKSKGKSPNMDQGLLGFNDKAFNYYIEESIYKNIKNQTDLNLYSFNSDSVFSQNPKKRYLLFVSSSSDCSSCINQQFSLMSQTFTKRKDFIVIVSDSLNFLKFDQDWPSVIRSYKKLYLSPNKLSEIFKNNGLPGYYLYSPSKGVSFSIDVDAQYSEFTHKILMKLRDVLTTE